MMVGQIIPSPKLSLSLQLHSIAPKTCVILLLLLPCLMTLAWGHGRMMDPPSRMSAWRFGFDVPKNYDDNAQYCGGFGVQWSKNGGKCGICGDRWDGDRPYERPHGKMVQKVIITKTYQTNAVIDVNVEVTANHLGWFEFRLCDVAKSGGVEATHQCLENHVLADRRGKTRFDIGSKRGFIRFKLRLPPAMSCDHCVMQWKWHCGNNPGNAQEEFYACSDISITGNGSPIVTQQPITMPPTRATPRPPIPIHPTPRPVYPKTTYPTIYPSPTYTLPPRVTLPPSVLAILQDRKRPLSERMWYYIKYQQAHNTGYGVWEATQVAFKTRDEQTAQWNGVRGGFGYDLAGNYNNNGGNGGNNNDNNNNGFIGINGGINNNNNNNNNVIGIVNGGYGNGRNNNVNTNNNNNNNNNYGYNNNNNNNNNSVNSGNRAGISNNNNNNGGNPVNGRYPNSINNGNNNNNNGNNNSNGNNDNASRSNQINWIVQGYNRNLNGRN